jgi:Restriction Enzyme Adenine Methylase Associated
MAAVVRDAFSRLAGQEYAPVNPPPGPADASNRSNRTRYSVRILDLLDTGLLLVGGTLINPGDDVEATVLADGQIAFDGTPYDSPSRASDAAHGGSTNGWTYWLADTPEGLRSIASLRDDLRASGAQG